MITRTFYTIEEAKTCLDDDAHMLRELVEFHGLRPYVKVSDVKAQHMDGDSFFEDSLVSSGSHELAKWSYLKHRHKSPDEDEPSGDYYLNGWFELGRSDAVRLMERGASENLQLASYQDGKRLGDFWNTGVYVSYSTVFFKAADVERLKTQIQKHGAKTAHPKESPKMRSDREQSLMRVIAGLWELSGLPAEPTTTADKLSALFDGWGWEKPSKSTIAETILAPAAKFDRIRK